MSERVICKDSTKKRVDQVLLRLCGWKGVHCHSLDQNADSIVVGLSSTHHAAKCPFCSRRSSSVHSTYERTLADLPVHGLEVVLKVEVSRYRCLNPKCSHKTFTAQCDGLTERYQRRTLEQRRHLECTLGPVSANVGSRQCSVVGMPISPSTALRIVRGISHDIDYASIRHLCIDDFAARKGREYRTLIIDADTHRPLEIVPSREKDDVKKALRKYKKATLVSRDRSATYAKAIHEAIPKARQVADRFHLVKNCGEHIERQMKRSMPEIRNEALESARIPVEEGVSLEGQFRPPTERDVELFRQVWELRKEGLSILNIAKKLKVGRRVVRRHLSSTEPHGMRVLPSRPVLRYMDIIKAGVAEGKGYKDIREDIIASGGYVAYKALRLGMKKVFPEYKPKGGSGLKPSPLAKANRERDALSHLLTSNKMHLYVMNQYFGVNKKTGECSDEHCRAEMLIQKSKTLQKLREAYLSFRQVINGNSVKDLDNWIEENAVSKHQEIAVFAKSLTPDIKAIHNTVRYSISNGPIEGCNNKVKAVKRSMYGRAKDDLLLIKIILYARNNLHEI